MANRKYVERVRDRLSSLLSMATDMNGGAFDGELEAAIDDLRRACMHLDGWLVRDRERRVTPKPRWVRVSADCVLRRRRVA